MTRRGGRRATLARRRARCATPPPHLRGRDLATGTARPCRYCGRPSSVLVLLSGLCLVCSDLLTQPAKGSD